MNDSDIDALLRQHADRYGVPGSALGLLRDGAVMTAYHGVADSSSGEPVTPETRFTLGSLTKPLVATVIARLAATGRLSLADSVAAHVPELRRASWAQSATVRDLLANRTRLPLRSATEFGFSAHSGTDDQALARLVAEVDTGPASFAGGFWSYTNVGWCVLGRVIETVTGAPWELAMRQFLFEDAEMDMTGFVSESDRAPRVVGHRITAAGAQRLEPPVARAYGPAGTSVVSTVEDLLRFASLHLDDPSLAELRAVQADLGIRGWFDAWCLGWARFDTAQGPIWGWDGLIGGERSFLRILPEHRAAIALMTNGDTGRAMYRSLVPELLVPFGIDLPPLNLDPPPAGAGDLSSFVGEYAWPDRRVTVATTSDGLLITTEQRQLEALALDERTFVVDAADPDNPTVTFGEFDASGRPGVLYLMLWGLPRVTSDVRS